MRILQHKERELQIIVEHPIGSIFQAVFFFRENIQWNKKIPHLKSVINGDCCMSQIKTIYSYRYLRNQSFIAYLCCCFVFVLFFNGEYNFN